jgi:hypothetical protein
MKTFKNRVLKYIEQYYLNTPAAYHFSKHFIIPVLLIFAVNKECLSQQQDWILTDFDHLLINIEVRMEH